MNWELFNQLPIVGILRGFSAEQTMKTVEACLAGGLSNLEITMNTARAAEIIKSTKEQVGEQMNIGAGTVCSLEDLEAALKAGAEYIVTPIVQAKVIQECKSQNVPVFCGAFSPTEVYQAWSLGADFVKVFPSDTLGSKYIKALKGPLNQIKLMPTGGVDLETIAEFKKAGADAFGIGGPLFNKTKIEEGNYQWITQRVIDFKNKFLG